MNKIHMMQDNTGEISIFSGAGENMKCWGKGNKAQIFKTENGAQRAVTKFIEESENPSAWTVTKNY